MLGSVIQKLRLGVLAFALGIIGVFATAQPAQAYASGCSTWGEIPIIQVPTGYMCFTIYGDGTRISSMQATWRTGRLCNWRIDWVIYYRGTTWWRSNGPAHNHCDSVSWYRTRGEGYAPHGSEFCAQLVNIPRNRRIEGVCHSITR